MLINNRQIHIESHGPEDGRPVVFLHHGLGSTRSWRNQIPPLVKAGYRVVAYDRWGYGQSGERPYLTVPGFEDDLADFEAILSTFNLQFPILIGHSDGGTIALYWAAQNPDKVSALVTVAAHIYLEPKMEPGIQQIQTAFESDSRFREGMRRMHGDKFETVFRNWFDGWHTPAALAWDMRPNLSKITCPTLVVQGQQDEHATPRHARDIAEKIPGAQLWLVPNGKHMLPQKMPDLFNQKLLEFISVL